MVDFPEEERVYVLLLILNIFEPGEYNLTLPPPPPQGGGRNQIYQRYKKGGEEKNGKKKGGERKKKEKRKERKKRKIKIKMNFACGIHMKFAVGKKIQQKKFRGGGKKIPVASLKWLIIFIGVQDIQFTDQLH